MRGFFGIGIDRCKTPANVGSLLRSAHAFDADFAFTVGKRGCGAYRRVATDTTDGSAHVPFVQYPDIDTMAETMPRGVQVVVVEVDGDRLLSEFTHPERAMYVLGPEDGSVHDSIRSMAKYAVRMPTRYCLNVAVAASIVMHDRVAKAAA